MKKKPLKILVFSSTRKERDGIAEYSRQVFRPEFEKSGEIEVKITDITPENMLAAPFKRADVLHIQHEFFMFDRLVGLSALFYYPYLWLWSKLLGFKIVTTIHSTYNVDDLGGALPHFAKFKSLFPLGSFYLRLHLLLVCAFSSRVLILSRIGMENLGRVVSPRMMARKVRYTHLGNYASHIHMQRHGLLEKRFRLAGGEKIFVLFGFAFPIKGYEYAIQAMDILVNQRGRKDVKLIVVSGDTGKGSFPGGGQGDTYIGWLKKLAAELKLEAHVIFTGYLANDDPLLEEIFAETFCFVFPYLDRNFPSGAISTTLATGKPVLVSDIRCFQEYEGLLNFKERDAAALAHKMTELLDNPAFVAQAAEITRHNAEKFDMQNIFATHLELYQELAGIRQGTCRMRKN
ncbi:MAG TPA: glycosyltransferase [Verrucomicrobiae bacterium]|jgi:glycosyltransferase involved in cell wall biosynthesis|nr:glycosyltransferase [Verrucomicrobiae bacterium]